MIGGIRGNKTMGVLAREAQEHLGKLIKKLHGRNV